MKGIILSILSLTVAVGIMAVPFSCYDIQYTENASGDSPYEGQTVDVTGVVTAVIPGTGFYMADPGGGPWSGLYVYGRNSAAQVSVGDEIIATGDIIEYSGLTELNLPTNIQIISNNNPVPAAIDLTTAQVPYNNRMSEQWEGVLVSIYDLTVTSTPDSYGQWKVSSGNAVSMIDDIFFNIAAATTINIGDTWHKITGIVDQHTAAGYKLNPRSMQDMIKENKIENSIIEISGIGNAQIGETYILEVSTSMISSEWDVSSYTMDLSFDNGRLQFNDVVFDRTLTLSRPQVSDLGQGKIRIHYQADQTMTANLGDILIKLSFTVQGFGNLSVNISEFKYGDTPVNNLSSGSLVVKVTEAIAFMAISTTSSSKNAFDPAMGEKLIIEYGTKVGFLSRALIRIYDAQGRLVATPVHKNFESSTGFESVQWDGRDSNMKRLEPGVYYCHAEVSNRETSKRYKTVQPVVIKARLK